MVAQPEFRHAALKHFLLDIRECRAGRIAGMLGVDMQILSDFHDSRPFSEFTVRLRNKIHTENRFFKKPSGRSIAEYCQKVIISAQVADFSVLQDRSFFS